MLPLLVQAADPLRERIVVAAVGPLVTVLVGGLAVWAITSTIQYRREAALKERADSHAEAERERAEKREDSQNALEVRARDDALRHELLDRMSESASPLYLMTQHYMRAKKAVKADPGGEAAQAALQGLRPALDAQYLASRASGDAIEHRLSGFFTTDAPRQEWHRVQDLLTLRYFQLIDLATSKLYEDNAGDEHSGLSIAAMANPKNVTNAYRTSMKTVVGLMFTAPLRSRSDPPDHDHVLGGSQ